VLWVSRILRRQDREITLKVTSCQIRIIFIPHRLHQETDTISLEEKAIFWRFNVAENNKRCLGLRVNCLILLPNFYRISISGKHFYKNFQYQFHGNSYSGSRSDNVDRRMDRQTERESQINGRTDKKKVIGDLKTTPKRLKFIMYSR
jgi:hypothetical protein